MIKNLYIQWHPLVHHIVHKYFRHIFISSNTSSSRTLDYDDLAQEAFVALILAARKYDPSHPSSASFKTYAYHAIYRAINRYVARNITPVSTGARLSAATIKAMSADETELLSAAIRCRMFSEVRGTDSEGGGDLDMFNMEVEDPAGEDGRRASDRRDWISTCLEILRRELSPDDMQFLMDRACGANYNELGEARGISREWARREYAALEERAFAILFERGETL